MNTIERCHYSTHEVAQAAGASYRRIHYWATQGTLRPERPRARHGQGFPWRWSILDAYEARVARLLSDLGATNEVIAAALREIEGDPEWWTCCSAFITVTGRVYTVACSDDTEAGWIVHLPSVRAEVDTMLISIPEAVPAAG